MGVHWKDHPKMYYTYHNMIQRCTNESHPSFKNYGGRGIAVCDRWLSSFENFLEDMGDVPGGMSLERKDNNKGYSPENCIWADNTTQRRNTRATRLNPIAANVIRYMHQKGITITELARVHHLNFYTVRDVIIGKTWQEV